MSMSWIYENNKMTRINQSCSLEANYMSQSHGRPTLWAVGLLGCPDTPNTFRVATPHEAQLIVAC